MQKLSSKSVWLFFFRFLTMFLIFAAGLSISLLSASLQSCGGCFIASLLYYMLLALVPIAIFCWIWAKLTYYYWGYQLTEEAFKKEQGVIYKKYVAIPYERIQNVDIKRGILARILGLSDLQIQTAGYSAYGGGRSYGIGAEGYLPGLDMKVAERLSEELIKMAKDKKQGL